MSGRTVDMSPWTGRVDTDEGPEALRWHQVIRPAAEARAPGAALIGFACDEGVRRNQGRVGARRGPAALRRILANLAFHGSRPLYEAGDEECADGDLERAQSAYGARVAELLKAGHLPIGLGGGHEIAFGSFAGLASYLQWKRTPEPRIGILNLDAHFDLRSAPVANSGTSFLRIADLCRSNSWKFNYCCLGIAEPSNTAALFRRARDLGAIWRLDTELAGPQLPETLAILRDWLSRMDTVYLTVCLDVLLASTAPGVSAPAARGVPLETVEHLVAEVKQAGKLAVADVAELNPDLDMDQHTARAAARLVYRIAR